MKLEDLTPEQLQVVQNNLAKLTPEKQAQFQQVLQELQKRKAGEVAQVHFLDFVKHMWPGFIGGRHHRIMAEKFEAVARGEIKRLAISLPPRHAIMTAMKIPTLRGLIPMADVVVGDYVFGPDGAPVKVLGKSEVFKDRELYRVTTDDGASLVVDGEHLWTVRLDRKVKNWRDYTTEDLWLRQEGWVVKQQPHGKQKFFKGKSNDFRAPMLPTTQPAQYPEKTLPIDPYVLGVWLGDGSRNNAVITCHDDDAVFVRPEIERRGYKTTDQATRYTFGVLGLQVQLRNLGVLNNKHIPRAYLEASPTQRRDLLKGLMDTDGNISQKGQCFFAQSNRAFIESVAELIRSLGVKANVLESEAKIGDKSYGPSWKISFYASDVCKLPRKEDRTLKNNRKFGRYIKVEKLAIVGDTQCIKVDRDDGLFLAGEGYICTHNTKSEFASYLLPAWFLGNYPQKQIMQASHTADLAVNFGRKVRNLVDSDKYKAVFRDVELQTDSKSAGRWGTNKGGVYNALGVGGGAAGKGADIFIIDDPHNEQDIINGNTEVFDKAWEWYMSGPRQRLQPGGAVIVVHTRWSKKDLIGRLLDYAAKNPEADQWEYIEFPAIFDEGTENERSLWPEFWPLPELKKIRNTIAPYLWNAQYMQNPTTEEGALIKKEWWRPWQYENPPDCEFVIMSLDPAQEAHNRADFSAVTVWGVFYKEDEDTGARTTNVIILDAWKARMEFPHLKREMIEYYREWQPDVFIVEKKSAGAALYQEFRAMGIPVSEFTPTKGNDKIARVNSITDMFASGMVWAPEGMRWAEEVMQECSDFPNGEHDDYVDTVSQALIRIRRGGFIKLPSDYEDDEVLQRYGRGKRLYAL